MEAAAELAAPLQELMASEETSPGSTARSFWLFEYSKGEPTAIFYSITHIHIMYVYNIYIYNMYVYNIYISYIYIFIYLYIPYI